MNVSSTSSCLRALASVEVSHGPGWQWTSRLKHFTTFRSSYDISLITIPCTMSILYIVESIYGIPRVFVGLATQYMTVGVLTECLSLLYSAGAALNLDVVSCRY